MNELWNKIIQELSINPRDIKTVPTGNREGKWFYAYSDGKSIFVTGSKDRKPSSSISNARKLENKKFHTMFDLYKRRNIGENVYKEAAEITRNQVYWYGIFNDFINN